MAHQYKNYPAAVMVAIDQLGNAITGGNPDSTVSARVGYFSVNATKRQALWKSLEAIIDYAFEPVDGPRHCYQAWQADKDEQFYRGSKFLRALLIILVVVACLVIAVVLRILVIFIRPWRYQVEQPEAPSQ